MNFIKKLWKKKVVEPIQVAQMPDKNKKLEFAYKILANQPTRFRNGKFQSVTRIEEITIKSSRTIEVRCTVRIRKRTNGSAPTNTWLNNRLNKIRIKLQTQYGQRLKYLGFEETIVHCELV
jgi:hypothetical protein